MLIIYLSAALALILLSYIVFQRIVRKDYLEKGRLSFLSYMLEFVVFALHANFIYVYIPVTWPRLPVFPEEPVLNIVSKILLYTGLIIVIIAMTGLGIGRTMGQDRKRLKKSGLYLYSRNPQVIGYALMLIAVFLFYPSVYAFGWLVIFAIMISFMINVEEEFLLKTYGNAYRAYCRKVPRFFRIS
ncbi:MAG: methyltransferase [candidate division KSB1 bacterium]|jgi:protein-S-isoprenylcysteine O-methyltransferase Ste14|nr:methyltransferase [candidate division KSB1 bacterium]